MKKINPNTGKENRKMKFKNIYLIAALMTLATMLGPATLIWAGVEGGGTPPDWEKVTGPEVWATVVVRCEPGESNFIAIRAKRIKDCNVLTQGLVLYPGVLLPGCFGDSNKYLYERLTPGTIFPGDPDIPPTFKPIVTKIKNFKLDDIQNETADQGWETATISFDAQIKFVDESTP